MNRTLLSPSAFAPRRAGLVLGLSLALAVAVAGPAQAFQAGLKVGAHLYPSSPYLDSLGAAGGDQGDLDGANVEAFVDFSLLPMISLELSVGGYSSGTTLDRWSTDLDLTGTYALITPKVHLLPLSKDFDLWVGAGAGWYSLGQSISVEGTGLAVNDVGVAGLHGVVGVGYYLTRTLLIFGEARYARALATNADGMGRDIDLGGAFLQGGVAIVW
jgi:hypothetical protein